MQKKINAKLISFESFRSNDYPEEKFSVGKTCFLSTAKNSHKLNISQEVLRRDAKTILGNFLVAKLKGNDATTHLPDEIIFGYFPREQEIEFKTEKVNGEDILKAYAYVVISKQYGKSLIDIFEEDNFRNVSVEMKAETKDENDNDVVQLDIYGLTCLGTMVKPSCPDANMSIVRFSENEAEDFFKKSEDSLNKLKQFMDERNQKMADKKTYKVDKSKKAVSDTSWGEVDKTELRNKIMDASNRDSLVKDVYMLVEDGWEEAPSEKLKYPVMELKGDTFVYNRYGLSSALGYAEKENEEEVIRKVKSIYKKLDIDSEGGKGDDTNMKDKKMDEIEGRKAWGKVIDKVQDHEGKGAYVDSIEDDHIIYTKEGVRYRVDADITVDPDDKSVAADIKWGTKKKDADQKMADDKDRHDDDDDDDDDKHDDDDDDTDDDDDDNDINKRLEKLEHTLEERDNIIMEKEKELKRLRDFERSYKDKEKAERVEAVMAEVKECLADEDFKKLRDEGLACPYEDVDGWANKVKATGFERTKSNKKKSTDLWRMSAPVDTSVQNQTGSIWDKL